MGCDIHLRTFLCSINTDVYQSKKKEYIDLSEHYRPELKDWGYSNDFMEKFNFPEIVGDRNYDLFCVLGNTSRRPYWQRLGGLKDDIPTSLMDYCRLDYEQYPDYYGFVHIDLNTMKKEVQKYISRIPYVTSDTIPHDFQNDSEKWLKPSLIAILDRIEEFERISKSALFNIECDLLGYNIDIGKTMFVMWFDN